LLLVLPRKFTRGNLKKYTTNSSARHMWKEVAVACSEIQIISLFKDELTLILLMWRKGCAPNSIPIYIQQDATLHSLFISGNCSTCFGWYFHPSLGAHTTVSTASGIYHTVTAICLYRGRDGTGLSVLWVAYATHSTLKPVTLLLLSAAIVEELEQV
jgi:hypothetical protein